MCRLGFTLIELLVVVAIIGILAAMLLPVLSKAKEQARRVICLANQKQISVGILSYAGDYDEVMPARGRHYWNWGNTALHRAAQIKVIYTDKYVPAAEVFVCPSLRSNTTPGSNGVKWFTNSSCSTYWPLGVSCPIATGSSFLLYNFKLGRMPEEMCLIQDAAMDGETCSSGWANNYVANHVAFSSRISQIRTVGANTVAMDDHGEWRRMADSGTPNTPPADWRLIGMWGAGGGAHGAYDNSPADGPYGTAATFADTSVTIEWGTYQTFGPQIFFGGGTPKSPMLGFYNPY